MAETQVKSKPMSVEKDEGADHGSAVRAAGRAGGIMVIALSLSRILGLLRDTVIASKFGLLSANDSYQIAARIPDIIFMLIAGGGLSSAFIPVFAEFWYTDKRKEAWKVFSVVVSLCSIIAVVLIAAAWVGAPWIVDKFGHDRQDAVPLAITMSRIMLPAQFAFLIGSILLATLYARKQFMGPALAPNVYNVGIIIGAAVLPGIFGFGIVGVAWGALVGAFIGNIVLPLSMMLRQEFHFVPSLDFRAPGVKKFFALLLPVILGFSLPSMVTLISTYFASPYGKGANTALMYGNNLMQAPLGIFGQSLALGAFPALSQFFAEKRMDHYRELVSKTLRTVLFLGIPSAVIMASLAPLIVKVIYGYGKAADEPGQLELIAHLLRIYCIGIPAWCVQPVLMRGFFSLHNTIKPVAIGTLMTVLFIVECQVALQSGWGLTALPWAANIAAIALVFILIRALEGNVGKFDHAGLISTAAKSLVAAVPAGLLGYLILGMITFHSKLLAAVACLLLGCLTWSVFYFFSRLLKMPESDYLERALARLSKRRPK